MRGISGARDDIHNAKNCNNRGISRAEVREGATGGSVEEIV